MKNSVFICLTSIGFATSMYTPADIYTRNKKEYFCLTSSQKRVDISEYAMRINTSASNIYIFQNFNKLDAKHNINNILTVCINDERMTRFIDPYVSSKTTILFRYEELPVYNKESLFKPDFNLYYKKNKIVKYNLNMKDEISNAVIIIESIIVDKNCAKVKLRIPVEGVYGEFSLQKNDSWIITKADVYET